MKKIVCILGLLLPVMLFPQKVIKLKSNFVLIDTDQNIGQIGDTVPLYRNVNGTEKEVGQVEIIKFKNKMCACKVVTGTIIVGDYCQSQVKYRDVMDDKVTATIQVEDQMAAINKQLAANTIKNVVSADRIQNIPDANTAESVGRLPGISVVRSAGEAQKVTIRGMEPKYNVIMVNGVRLESTDHDDRSVDLSLIAPNMLSGIEVIKALTADMDADAVGGTVNLLTGKAREGFHKDFSLQTGYGSLAYTYGNYKANGLLSNRFFDNKFGVMATGLYQSYDRSSDNLDAAFGWHGSVNDPDNFWLEDTEIRDIATDRERFGGSLVLDYQLSNGVLIYTGFANRLSNHSITQQNMFGADDNTWSGYAKDSESKTTVFNNVFQGEFDFNKIKMNFSVSYVLTQMRVPGELTMSMGPYNGSSLLQGWSNPNSTTNGDEVHMTPVDFINTIEVSTVRGVKTLTTLERNNDVSAVSGVLNFEVPFNLGNYLAGNVKLGGKFVRNKRKNDETQWGMDAATGINVSAIRDSVGTQWANYFGYELTDPDGEGLTDSDYGLPAEMFMDPNYHVGEFLSDIDVRDGIFINLIDISKMHDLENFAKDYDITYTVNGNTKINPMYQEDPQASLDNDYHYTRDFQAFYLMTTLNIGKHITFIPGIRYEKYNDDYKAYNIFVEDYANYPGDQSYYTYSEVTWDSTEADNWFPQIQLHIKPADWLDLRLASTQSIIYPDYRAASPYLFAYTYNSPLLYLGNPYLKPALTQNYDIYASIYENHIGLFTAGFFYKEIDNLIVPISYKTNDASVIHNRYPLVYSVLTEIDTWTNLEATSTVKGIELGWQTYVPFKHKGLFFDINYTHIKSETRYPYLYSTRTSNPPFYKYVYTDTTRAGRLINQPNDIMNLMLGYDYHEFTTRLSFSYQDNVLKEANSTYNELDEYTDAYYRWDFTACQTLPWLEGLQLYLNVNNITNRPDRQHTGVLEKLSMVEYYGRTMDFGVRYKF